MVYCRTLADSKRKCSGRGSSGKITVRHRGGGLRTKVYYMNKSKSIFDQEGVIESFFYNPQYTAKSAVVIFKRSGLFFYTTCPDLLRVNDVIKSVRFGDKFLLKVGYSVPIRRVYNVAVIHFIEIKNGFGGQFVRSAGTFAKVLDSVNFGLVCYVRIKLPSKKVIYINGDCLVTLGRVS